MAKRKLISFNDIAKDSLDEWIYFLKNEEIKENFKAKGLIKAKQTLDIMKLPEQERLAYESYQEDLHLQASMFESSYTFGIQKGVKKVALKMLKTGKFSNAEIVEATELNLDQVQALAQEIS